MSVKLRALLVEDSEDDALLVLDVLRQGGFDVDHRRVTSRAEMRDSLSRDSWDLVLSDYTMPGFDALEALEVYQEANLDIPFLIVSGSIGEEIAVETMRLGAHDYLLKDRLRRLPAAVERELREAENRRSKRAVEREREQQNQELSIRAEQLYRSNKDLERFAFLAAHDLQEPLRTVNSYSQMLARRYHGKDTDTDEIVGYITGAVYRMEALIQGLLSYSRMTHAPDTALAPVDVNTVVAQVLRTSEQRIQETGAQITVEPLPTIMADPVQLPQVFQNLLSNALKYRKKDVPPEIRITAEEHDDEYVFAVRDNGIGIAREYFDRIFLIFRRLHRESDYPGIGIGLALAKRVLENMGGRIWLESRVGEGSTFYFAIPKAEASAASASGREH